MKARRLASPRTLDTVSPVLACFLLSGAARRPGRRDGRPRCPDVPEESRRDGGRGARAGAADSATAAATAASAGGAAGGVVAGLHPEHLVLHHAALAVPVSGHVRELHVVALL